MCRRSAPRRSAGCSPITIQRPVDVGKDRVGAGRESGEGVAA